MIVLAAAFAVLASGCLGYARSAKRWSYAGNVVLILGGGAAIAGGALSPDEPCEGAGCPRGEVPIDGAIVAGAILAMAGLAGIVLTATRPVPRMQSR